MANPLSTLGIIHTAVSLAPVVAGLYGFARYGAIAPATRSGKIYLATLVLAVLTSAGLSSTGGFNEGHALGIVTLLVIAGSLAATRLNVFGRLKPYLTTLGFSFTYFLLMVPGINETLSRLPVSQPLASGPESPIVQTTLLVWLVIFLSGVSVQTYLIHKRAAARARAPLPR
ncbi:MULTISPECIES: hypothetical protein [unclassified Ensifer]|uniref:hypothetical protein n=1 Tax=unclassified Ensifer TaxID=2633371 RepID=UPI0008137D83|nr:MULTISPECIES: hypothetical protein [unclassified Ensifer]OCP07139.1 hypothetical protein BBX50_22475 [Ensifer sp. LC11]OCP07721.1 hypothetical protein BC374_22690 [Ensifer sp. LC13]OCP12117.1 hypothetical protein BC362_06590 [Ensifer sp. LC14]OCP31828.1 hypothetical protein BC364_22010 [Ensifer sp. LC499]